MIWLLISLPILMLGLRMGRDMSSCASDATSLAALWTKAISQRVTKITSWILLTCYVSAGADGIRDGAAVSRKDAEEGASADHTCNLYRLEWHQWRVQGIQERTQGKIPLLNKLTRWMTFDKFSADTTVQDGIVLWGRKVWNRPDVFLTI